MYCSKCGTQLDEDDAFCPNCGAAAKRPNQANASPQSEPQQLDPVKYPYQASLIPKKENEINKIKNMKVWKQVSGIISIILFFLVFLQSCAAGVTEVLNGTGGTSGWAGVIVALMLLIGGIVSIAVCNGGKAGNTALVILFGIGAIIGFSNIGIYEDLILWSAWCAVCALLAALCIFSRSI